MPGAVVTLSRDGGYASHQRVDFNDDAAYLSLDRSGSYLFGVSYGNGRFNAYRLGEDGLPGKAIATVDEGRVRLYILPLQADYRLVETDAHTLALSVSPTSADIVRACHAHLADVFACQGVDMTCVTWHPAPQAIATDFTTKRRRIVRLAASGAAQ